MHRFTSIHIIVDMKKNLLENNFSSITRLLINKLTFIYLKGCVI